MRSMSLVDMPPIELSWKPFPRRRVVVKLMDGPCAGTHAQVAEGSECWQRVGKPGGVGVETQMWARYDVARPGKYVYSGVTVTTEQLYAGLKAAEEAGHTHGESYGA